MKLIRLNEEKLLEKEINSQTLKDITISKNVQDEIAVDNWQKAYDDAGFGVEEGQLYVVFVDYKPTQSQLNKAKNKKGTYPLPSGQDFIKGYLKQQSTEKIETGGFLNLKNIEDFGYKFIDIVDETDPNKIVENGYFKILETQKDASVYSEKDAKALVKKIKGFGGGSGVRVAREEPVTRKDIGKKDSEKDLVLDAYLKNKFGTAEKKIEEFRDYLEKLIIETGFDKNPVVTFLQDYLKTSELSRKGFIALNNLYAREEIEAVDFLSSNLTPLLKSNIFEQGTDDALNILELYKSILYTYLEFNKSEVKSLQSTQTVPLDINIDKYGELKDVKSKKNLADLVVYKPNLLGSEVDTPENIKEKILKIRNKQEDKDEDEEEIEIDSTDVKTKTDIKVVGKVSPTLEPSQENRFKSMLKGLTKDDMPTLMRYLKNGKLIG
jgi:hypothetical protein